MSRDDFPHGHVGRLSAAGAAFCVLLVPVLLVGCSRELMPTPNLYLGSHPNPFGDVPPALRSSRIDVLYITDRHNSAAANDPPRYGHQRSQSMAFGSCIVEIGRDLSWDTLVANSITDRRSAALPMTVKEITEGARFPETPLPAAAVTSGVVTLDAAQVALEKTATDALRTEIHERLARTKCKDAFVYIHGFNNSFEDAVFVAAELWHFMGRGGVPVAYTWPAGIGGLMGYAYDRESGEFTIFHLKQFLRILASCEELRRIHILAHSRGADVVLSAIRELVIAERASGTNPLETLKIGNVVLAAADIDVEVASQRFVAERVTLGLRRATVYVSQDDIVIRFARWLFESIRRLGRILPTDVTDSHKKRLAVIDRVDIVHTRKRDGFLGHEYFHSSPEVSSDLILLLRDNLRPGGENGRPLEKLTTRFWAIRDGYPWVTRSPTEQ